MSTTDQILERRSHRRECAWCYKVGANAGLTEIVPGDEVWKKDPMLDGLLLCNDCRWGVITGRI